MEIIWLPIQNVTRYENNPRDNARAVEKVAASIRDYGWQQPIVVDSQHVIIAGDTRYQAAQLLGLDSVPVLVASGLSPEKVRAYRLADNKTGEFAKWDDQKLAEELQSIMESIGSIELTGFSSGEYEALAMQAEAIIAELEEPETEPAPAPAVRQPTSDTATDAVDNAPEELEGDTPEDEPARPAMVPLNLLMTVEDRQAVYDAIAAAKSKHGIETSAEALAVICRNYSND